MAETPAVREKTIESRYKFFTKFLTRILTHSGRRTPVGMKTV